MKILYVVDYLHNEANSVGDILSRIIYNPSFAKNEQIVYKASGLFDRLSVRYVGGFKTYSFAKPKDNFFTRKLSSIKYYLRKLLAHLNLLSQCKRLKEIKQLKHVLRREKPDAVIFFTYAPNPELVELIHNEKLFCLLYDTYISRPTVEYNAAYELEKYVINKAEKYFVPSFFFGDYEKAYHCGKIQSYDLPLLVDKDDVIKAYSSTDSTRYRFAYFGQIQQFRNGDRIKTILKCMGEKVDIFSPFSYETDDVFICHSGEVTGDELYLTVANSDFLIAFDNSKPYDRYLPSKAYLYVSFTKPIVVFGDNDESALRDFLKDYPDYYYQNINETVDGLIEFLSKKHLSGFDEETYQQYIRYASSNALGPVAEIIFE